MNTNGIRELNYNPFSFFTCESFLVEKLHKWYLHELV
jgi:hypothetical protein